jgi:hypothetical protein
MILGCSDGGLGVTAYRHATGMTKGTGSIIWVGESVPLISSRLFFFYINVLSPFSETVCGGTWPLGELLLAGRGGSDRGVRKQRM